MPRIVFDLDGTLIDSAPDIQAAVNRMLDDEGLEPLDLAAVTSFIGNGLPHLVKLAMAARGMDKHRHADIAPLVGRHYDAVNGHLTVLYPGVEAALHRLKADGHSLALCTNKPARPACDILGRMGIYPLFDQVIGGDSLPERKPDPAPLLACQPGLYVGDSEVDAETAARADVRFILFTEGYRKVPVAGLPHDALFSNFAALPDIVQTFERLQ
ncbi:phosphoglycolate phosphatase [Pseudogemmobacter sp. W21_MBD1_M6]|uniref:phosphoglycolate phosphatase n=1 Tax=Pseudogemmobacter sp. W21_MBD1_M6 TaxID=3240271 RepID=UPI003F9B1236